MSPTYQVTEVVRYQVDAPDAETAEEMVMDGVRGPTVKSGVVLVSVDERTTRQVSA